MIFVLKSKSLHTIIRPKYRIVVHIWKFQSAQKLAAVWAILNNVSQQLRSPRPYISNNFSSFTAAYLTHY